MVEMIVTILAIVGIIIFVVVNVPEMIRKARRYWRRRIKSRARTTD